MLQLTKTQQALIDSITAEFNKQNKQEQVKEAKKPPLLREILTNQSETDRIVQDVKTFNETMVLGVLDAITADFNKFKKEMGGNKYLTFELSTENPLVEFYKFNPRGASLGIWGKAISQTRKNDYHSLLSLIISFQLIFEDVPTPFVRVGERSVRKLTGNYMVSADYNSNTKKSSLTELAQTDEFRKKIAQLI